MECRGRESHQLCRPLQQAKNRRRIIVCPDSDSVVMCNYGFYAKGRVILRLRKLYIYMIFSFHLQDRSFETCSLQVILNKGGTVAVRCNEIIKAGRNLIHISIIEEKLHFRQKNLKMQIHMYNNFCFYPIYRKMLAFFAQIPNIFCRLYLKLPLML